MNLKKISDDTLLIEVTSEALLAQGWEKSTIMVEGYDRKLSHFLDKGLVEAVKTYGFKHSGALSIEVDWDKPLGGFSMYVISVTPESILEEQKKRGIPFKSFAPPINIEGLPDEVKNLFQNMSNDMFGGLEVVGRADDEDEDFPDDRVIWDVEDEEIDEDDDSLFDMDGEEVFFDVAEVNEFLAEQQADDESSFNEFLEELNQAKEAHDNFADFYPSDVINFHRYLTEFNYPVDCSYEDVLETLRIDGLASFKESELEAINERDELAMQEIESDPFGQFEEVPMKGVTEHSRQYEIVSFRDIEEVIEASKSLKNSGFTKTRLFFRDGHYYITLDVTNMETAKSDDLQSRLLEWGSYTYITPAVLEEYGTKIIARDVFGVLSEKFK